MKIDLKTVAAADRSSWRIGFASAEYRSPFELFLQGSGLPPVESRQGDVIFESDSVLALVCSRQIAGHEGHSLVIAKAPYESLFDMPVHLGGEVFTAVQLVAKAMLSALGCHGVTVLQNNGPASDQTVFHYHVHIVPRFANDTFLEKYARHRETQVMVNPARRQELARKLTVAVARLVCA